MQDYDNMNYWNLKNECKKKGLDSKGKREALLERLQGKPEKPIPEPKAIIPATQEDLNKYLPQASFTPKVDITRFKPWLTEQRLQKLTDELNPIFAGNAKFDFQLNYEQGEFQIQFSGGAAGTESLTMIVEDKFIIRKAQEYCKRKLARGGDNQTSSI